MIPRAGRVVSPEPPPRSLRTDGARGNGQRRSTVRIHAAINERTVRRTFKERKPGSRGLTVIDKDLPQFGLTIAKNKTKTFFVRVLRPVGATMTILGTTDEMTAAEAREKALAAIAAAKAERETGPLFADFADEFMRRQARRWKPSTRENNRLMLRNYLLPSFGAMRVAEIVRADVRRWFDAMSGTPGNANRTLPVLSVMMRQAELWDLHPQGSNPCRDMRRYRTAPRQGRFVFPNRKGDGPMTDLGLRWHKLRDLAGLDGVVSTTAATPSPPTP